MKPKEITNQIQLPDGRELPLTTKHEDIETLRKDLSDAKEDYRCNPNRRHFIRLHHTQAKVDDANGKTKEAAEDLLLALNPDNLDSMYPDTDERMKSLLDYQDAVSLLVELLLRLGRVDEALGWADKIRILALEYFLGTDAVPYAMGLYACCLEASGKKSDAAYYYESILLDIEESIAELGGFRQSIKSNLDGLWK